MRNLVAAVAIVLCVSCSSGDDGSSTPTPTSEAPPIELTSTDLQDAVLALGDVGDKWDPAEDTAPSTVLIGGEVGPGNIDIATADATTAFVQKEGSGYLSDSVILLKDETIARQIMARHEEADTSTRWNQDRTDGGRMVFRRVGRVANLNELGDEMYSAALTVNVADGEGTEAKRTMEYVVYRIKNLLAFVVAQDARAAVYAHRQEAKVARLTG